MAHFYHNMLYILIFSLVLCSVSTNAQNLLGKYPIQNFTPTDYKAGIQNIDFAQNRDMTIFVANNLGILSFDGNQWNTHDFKTGKKKRSLTFDPHTNRLYVGSQGEFGYFEENWHYISLTDIIPEDNKDFDEVWDVFQIDSKVFFCTFQGIYIYDSQSINVLKHKEGLGRSFQADGKIFTQSQRGVLYEIEDNQLVQSYQQARTNQVIAGLIPENGGYLIFYNSGQIAFTTPLGVSSKYEELVEALQGTYVNHVTQLSDTRLVISTQTAGLFLYDKQSGNLEPINTTNGLGSNACLRSFQDYFGNLWVGMQNGIALIDINSPMRLINREINIQGSGYEAFNTNEGTYFSTSNGIYFLANKTTKSIFLEGTEGPAYSIQEIGGKLYAGHHRGLFLLERGKARHLAPTDGLWKVEQLKSDSRYAIGGTYSGLFLFKINEAELLEPVQRIRGFNASSRFFEEDRSGKIWAGQYYKGLYQLTLSPDKKETKVLNISEESDSPIQEQIILSKLREELFLSSYSGLYQVTPNQEPLISTSHFSEVIGDQPVYLFQQDQKNNVHVIAENTVGFFKQISAGNYQFFPSSLYQLRFHLNNDLLHISMNYPNGVLFSANEGFIHYVPDLEVPFNINNPLIVSRVYSVTEDSTLYAQKPFEAKPESIAPITVSPQDKVLKIEVEAFQFKDLNNQQFRYFLKGFDEDYGQWTSSTVKEYTNLREGHYEFIAQYQDHLGKIATSQALHLQVKPPFYRSLVAQILYVIGGVLTLFLISRFQKYRYVQKAQRIEYEKQLELSNKQQKINDLEQQKKKELLELKEEKMKSELQHLNKLLATSTMNLVVKNEFIESIKEELNEVQHKGKKIETKQALQKIVKGIDTNLRIQDDWEQFEYHFEKVHVDFLARLRKAYPNLTPNEQKLCAFLRLNLHTKEIANLLSISLRGVEVARYRLRKKLGLEKGQNLAKFILEY